MSPTIVDLTASSPAVTTLSEELPVETVLKHAILDAQLERLRVTLQHICNDSPEAFRIARSLLLVPEEIVKHKTIDRRNRLGDDTDQDEDEDEDEEDSSEPSDDEGDSEDSDDASAGSSSDKEEEEDRSRVLSNEVTSIQSHGVKRLRPKFATCTNCSEEFDVTDNGKYSCTWHPGEREPDYEADTWTDHDENCHGRISDLEDEYPEGFMYNCCEREGTAEGCRIGTHVEKEISRKRARY